MSVTVLVVCLSVDLALHDAVHERDELDELGRRRRDLRIGHARRVDPVPLEEFSKDRNVLTSHDLGRRCHGQVPWWVCHRAPLSHT